MGVGTPENILECIALGVDMFTTEGHVRMAGALADFYTHPLLDSDLLEKIRGAMQS